MLQDIRSYKTAKSVMRAYNYNIDVEVGICILIIVSLIYMISILPNIKTKYNIWKRKFIVTVVFILIGQLISNGNILQYIDIFNYNLWSIESNYQSKGLLLTLISELQYFNESTPKEYSIDVVKEIIAETEKIEYVNNVIKPENLIVIMNESWADFRYIAGFDGQDSITPYMDSIEDNTIKGFLHMPVFGAGTANSEYEVLTGNSMQLMNAGTTPYQLYINNTEWGMVSLLKEQGYRTIALHPNSANNWNRDIIYKHMQFDEFISIENWNADQWEIIRWCMSDESCYDSLISLYADKESGENLFSFLVTMQNHGGYDWNEFNSTAMLNFYKEYPMVEQYLSLIQLTDKAFYHLIDYFENVNEPTMIVMFGDHLPNLESGFYEELFQKSLNDLTMTEKQNLYVAPFIIWTNYDMETTYDVEMSANFFGSYIFNLAGLKMSEYYNFINNTMQEIPIIGIGALMDKDGNWYDRNELPTKISDILNKYEMLQYNNVFDNRGKLNQVFKLP